LQFTHYKLHTAHCTLHTAHCTLHTALSTLDTHQDSNKDTVKFGEGVNNGPDIKKVAIESARSRGDTVKQIKMQKIMRDVKKTKKKLMPNNLASDNTLYKLYIKLHLPII
jgi:hypothetical protein